MDINDVIKAKIEMENSISNAVREAMENFKKKTGVTPNAINIHLASEEIIRPGRNELYSRVQHAVIGVEATVTF